MDEAKVEEQEEKQRKGEAREADRGRREVCDEE